MTTSDRPVTLFANDGGRVLLSEAAARQSTKLTGLLVQQPTQREFTATEFVVDTQLHYIMTTIVLQQLADSLEHFVTTLYPTVAKPNPRVPSWDDIGGQWLGQRLRHMGVQTVLNLQAACSTLQCEQLTELVASYCTYRLTSVRYRRDDPPQPAVDYHIDDPVVARFMDDSIITP